MNWSLNDIELKKLFYFWLKMSEFLLCKIECKKPSLSCDNTRRTIKKVLIHHNFCSNQAMKIALHRSLYF
ncbi:hypothetical protein CVS40_7095 [Lucilia cuprina]|nr:hypothetical protein CVS40_7095 [Lucilia cuprina]